MFLAIALSSALLSALLLAVALALPWINSPTVPFGVRVPAQRADDPTVVRQTRIYRWRVLVSGIVAAGVGFLIYSVTGETLLLPLSVLVLVGAWYGCFFLANHEIRAAKAAGDWYEGVHLSARKANSGSNLASESSSSAGDISRIWEARARTMHPSHIELTNMPMAPLETRHLPAGVHSRFVESVNGLRMHVLEAGDEKPSRPLLLLLHGFPELAYSWRKVMVPLAELGYHVVAPDQRGYGRTTGWSATYDQDLRPFSMLNLACDAVALTFALGYRQAAAVIGHDFGSPVASWCALTRPDVYQRCAILSAPFAGSPTLPFGPGSHPGEPGKAIAGIEADLGRMPRPRKHYQRYYSTRSANDDMWRAPEGVGTFLRAYFHYKSADWTGNKPHPLASFSADELAKMPTYYVMDRDQTMAETVRPFAPSATEIAGNQWLPDAEIAVYAQEYERTGFQGGLNWYRASLEPDLVADLTLFSGKAIDVPSMFIGGQSDWGTYQMPGALDIMRETAFARMTGVHLVPGAGHWVQQEQPESVVEHLHELLAIEA